MKLKIGEAGLWRQIKDQNARIEADRADTLARIARHERTETSDPITDIAWIRPEGATKMCDFDRYIRLCYPPQWVDDAEYERRLFLYRGAVLPSPSHTPGHVVCGLSDDGSVLETVRFEIPCRDYFRRFRKWRRLWNINEKPIRADLPHIERVTGWTVGCNHWFLQLLGLGPRPRRN